MTLVLTSFAWIFIVDRVWGAAGLHIVAGINRVQIERCEDGEAGEQERAPRCEVHDRDSGAGIEVQTERDDRGREGGEWEVLGEMRSLSRAGLKARLCLRRLCSHSGAVICAAGLNASYIGYKLCEEKSAGASCTALWHTSVRTVHPLWSLSVCLFQYCVKVRV